MCSDNTNDFCGDKSHYVMRNQVLLICYQKIKMIDESELSETKLQRRLFLNFCDLVTSKLINAWMQDFHISMSVMPIVIRNLANEENKQYYSFFTL